MQVILWDLESFQKLDTLLNEERAGTYVIHI